jgi:hypothetical protein
MADDENLQESPRSAFAQRRWLVSIVLVIAIGVLVIILSSKNKNTHDSWCYAAVTVAMVLILVWIAVRFVDLFTSQLSDNHSDEDKTKDKKAVTRMVSFSYKFMLSALVIPFCPALLLWLGWLVAGSSLPKGAYDALVNSPVGLVKGCVHAPKDTDWELACRFPGEAKEELVDPYFAEWLVNIGGSAQFRCESSPSTCAPAEVAKHPEAAKPAQPPESAKLAEPATPSQSVKPPELPLNDSVFRPVTIHGGLAVPWYFLTLAIMGAAVSMARRVPEYQRRVQYGPPSGGEKIPDDAMTPSMVREELLFQVLQVLSAPLIAITAYNAIMPNSRATSVALGFVSGFSSESVLLAIRSVADKIKPASDGTAGPSGAAGPSGTAPAQEQPPAQAVIPP